MAGGFRSLFAFWLGGASSKPAAPSSGGFRSLLAFWMGGAASSSGPPPPVNPGGEGGVPVGGGNIWYTPEMLRLYREHQARMRRYEPEDDREALRAIVDRAMRGNTDEVLPEPAKLAQAIQVEAGATLDVRVTLKEIRALLAEVDRAALLYAQERDDEVMMIAVGMLL